MELLKGHLRVENGEVGWRRQRKLEKTGGRGRLEEEADAGWKQSGSGDAARMSGADGARQFG